MQGYLEYPPEMGIGNKAKDITTNVMNGNGREENLVAIAGGESCHEGKWVQQVILHSRQSEQQKQRINVIESDGSENPPC